MMEPAGSRSSGLRPSSARFEVLDWSQLSVRQRTQAQRILKQVYAEPGQVDPRYRRLALVRYGPRRSARVVSVMEYGNPGNVRNVLLEAIASHPQYGPQAAMELRRPPSLELLLHLKEDLPVGMDTISGTFRKDGRRLLSFLNRVHGVDVRPRLPRVILNTPFQRKHAFSIGSLNLEMKATPTWREAR